MVHSNSKLSLAIKVEWPQFGVGIVDVDIQMNIFFKFKTSLELPLYVGVFFLRLAVSILPQAEYLLCAGETKRNSI